MDVENLRRIMSTADGRQLISEILQLCQYGQYEGEGNALKDASVFGKRQIGADIVAQIKMIDSANESADGLALLYLMEREQQRREREET